MKQEQLLQAAAFSVLDRIKSEYASLVQFKTLSLEALFSSISDRMPNRKGSRRMRMHLVRGMAHGLNYPGILSTVPGISTLPGISTGC
jgi:hypothetical protein